VDPAVLILLTGLLLIAAQAAWFGFINPVNTLAWLQQASFVVTAFMLIPLVLFVLYSQATSIDRLNAMGIKPHPAIRHAVGIANGRGENPVWVLSLNDEAVQILDFYRKAMANTQWRLSEDNDLYLRYRRAGQTLTIANKQQSGDDTLIISVTTKP
jgi:hypothetical protein